MLYLPSPEERILEGIHASQRKIEQSILYSLVPIPPVVPEWTIRVRGSVWLDAPHVETTIVDGIAIFPRNGDTKARLAKKKGRG